MSDTTSGPSYAQQLADFVRGLRYESIPEEVRAAVRCHVLDSVGVMVATDAAGTAIQGRELAQRMRGAAEATAVGVAERVPAVNAALANGMLAHALDFDDSHSGSVTHPSAVIVPAALAAAEMTGATPVECITAAVGGYEINARIGAVAGSEFMLRGFHSTALAGAFAAAAVAGKLMGLSSKQLVSAMGLVGSQASGLIEFLSDGTDAKQLHAGWAAHAGLVAAFFAGHGLSGPATVLEGRYGLYAAHLGAGAVSPAGMTATLGTVWTTAEITYKAYPACHLTHTAVDALLWLMRENEFVTDDIEVVHCRIPEYYVSRVLEPIEHKYRPRTAYEAKFSLPFCIASAAHQGTLALASFERDALADEAVLALARKVSYEVVNFPEFPAHYPGAVAVTLKDGRVFERAERHNRVLGRTDLLAKFHRNCDDPLGADKAGALADGILRLGLEDTSVATVLAPLRYGAQSPSQALFT